MVRPEAGKASIDLEHRLNDILRNVSSVSFISRQVMAGLHIALLLHCETL